MDRVPAGFLSYARVDDEYEEGYLTLLRERLEKEVRLFTGEDFAIFQDRIDLRWGEEWAIRIEQVINSVTFLFPVLTPSFFKSKACLQELQEFLCLEKRSGRRDLVLPVYYLESLIFEKADRRAANPLAQELSTRQYVDWRDLRGTSFRDPRVRTRIAMMARQVRDALDSTFSSPSFLEGKQGQGNDTQSAYPLLIKPEIRSTAEVPSLEERENIYEDFVLQISRDSNGDYVLRVLNSPAGEGVDKVTAEYALQGIEGVSQNLAKIVQEESSQEIEDLGEQMYQLLMPPVIRHLFIQSLAHLGPARGLRLVLRLGLEDPTVAPFWTLPWEYMYVPEEHFFLGLTRKCLIVRTLDLPFLGRPPARSSVMRVLVVAANTPRYSYLDLEREIADIERAVASGLIEIEVIRDATLDAVRHALREGEFHGIHFTGHGAFDEGRGEGSLLFRDLNDEFQSVSSYQIANILSGFPSLRFAVLNASYSGKIASVNPLGSVAAALLRTGISAVVALQSQIADVEAISFSEAFYHRLAAGDPIEVAVSEGRLAIALINPNGFRWGSPVLYTRVPDGRLFQSQER